MTSSDQAGSDRIVWPLSLYLTVALCFGAAFALLYPGIMSYDSVYVYRLSETLQLDDWHPPAYTLLIRYLRRVADSPASVLAFNLTMFSVGSFFLAKLARRRHSLFGHLVPFVLFLPFVVNFVGVLWKDTAQAVCWWAAASIALYAYVGNEADGSFTRCKTVLLVGCAALFLILGLFARHNAVVAAPFMITALGLATLKPSRVGVRWLTVALTAASLSSAAILFAGNVVIDRLYGVTKAYPLSSLIIYDLAGITRNSGINAFPTAFTPAQIDAIAGCYQLNDWNSYGDKCAFVAQALQAQKWTGTGRLTQHWFDQMLLFPGAYLKHRSQYYFFFLRLGYDEGYYIVHPGGIDENDLGLRHTENRAFRAFIDYVRWFQGWPVMKPWFWLLASLGLSAYWGSRTRCCACGWMGLLVSASSLVYIVSYLVVGVAADFRYIYWSILGSLFAALLLVVCPSGRHFPKIIPELPVKQVL